MGLASGWRALQRASPFAGRILVTTGANLLITALNLVTGVGLARLLGPAARGELAAIQMWPSFLVMIAMLGAPEAVAFCSARDPASAGRWAASGMALAALASAPFMVAGFFLLPPVLSSSGPHVVASARWYLLLLPLYALVPVQWNVLQGLNDLGRWNAVRLGQTAGWLAVVGIAWAVGARDAHFLAMGHLVMLACLFVPVFAVVSRRVPDAVRPDASKLGALFAFGFPTMLASLPAFLNARLDQMLMVALVAPEDLGLYVVAVAWGSGGTALPGAIGAAMLPRIAGPQTLEQRREALAQGTRLAIPVALLLAITFAGATPIVFPVLLGSSFRAAVPAALVMSVAGAVCGVNVIVTQGLRGWGKPSAGMWAEAGGVAVGIASLLLLLRPLGILGAALASLLGASTVATLLLLQARRLTGLPMRRLLVFSRQELLAVRERLRALRGASRGDAAAGAGSGAT